MDQVLDKSYRNAVNQELSKFTCVVADSGTYADGCTVPAAANAKCLGVLQTSIIPPGFGDYANGVYTITSGTAWPAGAIGIGLGKNCRVRKAGITSIRAASAIARGDFVNIADTQGRVKTVNEVGGTTVHIVGEAEEAATQADDVIRVRLILAPSKA